MSAEIRFWKIQKDNHLKPVKTSKLDLEARLEDWLEEEISILDKGLFVIGRQVPTEFSGAIDLLCMDGQGDLVIIELKRDKTPREITAQILDYASWVKDISRERVVKIADDYLWKRCNGKLEEIFQGKFKTELPDVLNETHSMMIVATQIDPSSERIIRYLSDTYGVRINAATFQYFIDEGDQEYLGRVFLIKPSQVERKSHERGASKRKPDLTIEELINIADENGVGEFYRMLSSTLEKHLKKATSISSLRFVGILNGSRKVVFSLIPTESDSESGLKFQIYIYRFMNFFNIEKDRVLALLPGARKEWVYASSTDPDYSGFEGYFRAAEEVEQFSKAIKILKSNNQT